MTTTAPCLTRALLCASILHRVPNPEAIPALLTAVRLLVNSDGDRATRAALGVVSAAYWETQRGGRP